MEATLEEGGGRGPVRKDTSSVKKKKTEGGNHLDHGPKSPPWRTTVLNLEFKPWCLFVVLVAHDAVFLPEVSAAPPL